MKRLTLSLIFICLTGITLSSRDGYADFPAAKDAIITVNGTGRLANRCISTTIVGKGHGEKNPDLYLESDRFYPGLTRYSFDSWKDGCPVFKYEGAVTLPDEIKAVAYKFVEYGNSTLLFWAEPLKPSAKTSWSDKRVLHYATFNPATQEIGKDVKSISLTRNDEDDAVSFNTFDVRIFPDDKLEIYTIKNTVPSTGFLGRDNGFHNFDGAGIFRYQTPYYAMFKYTMDKLGQESASGPFLVSRKQDFQGGAGKSGTISLLGKDGAVVVTRFGGFYFCGNDKDYRFFRYRITDTQGNAMRNPSIASSCCSYPDEKGNCTSLISAGEGGTYYYSFSGHFSENGKPMFKDPVAVLEVNPPLHGGSLITPTIADWDNDGKLDIITGNSAGFILFHKNYGSNEKPVFKNSEYLKAGGKTIFIQPGYGEDVQGPMESRWGYIGANVYDWNKDGYLDILTNDSRSKHMVFLGSSRGLDSEHPLYLDDLALRGTWRCRPGVGELDGKTVYITLDNQDEIHLYIREDNYNVTDGGKLRLRDGRSIGVNILKAGATGRVRFELVDWDGDGKKDLLLGTNADHKIPSSDPDGLPRNFPRSERGSTILFLKNVGTDAAPAYEFPKQLKYKGQLISFVHHACSGATGMLGKTEGGLPNLLVGDETGCYYLFERKYISW